VANDICKEHGKAAVITAANMFAHVAKLGDLLRGVDALLDDGGMFVTESHYLMDLIQTVQYDSIYHEHLKYYTLKSLLALFEYYNFTLVDVERIPNYGGSIRVFAQKGKGRRVTGRVHDLLHEEEKAKLFDAEPFASLKEKVLRSKMDLQALLISLRRRGKSVVGVGSPGRASTLLNYCNIDPDLLPYIAEQSSSLKLGLFIPGCHIPVVDEKIMFEENPDYVVMLSWHYAQPIIRNLRQKGLKSKIILPLPEVSIIES
jgi:hypothetical protein